jgi:hypothetical protein
MGVYKEITRKQYCKFYHQFPATIEERVLCNGLGLWKPCKHYKRCLDNSNNLGRTAAARKYVDYLMAMLDGD